MEVGVKVEAEDFETGEDKHPTAHILHLLALIRKQERKYPFRR